MSNTQIRHEEQELLPNQRRCPNSDKNPNCEIIINYISRWGLVFANKNNTHCKSCRIYSRLDHNGLDANQRFCSNKDCNKILTYHNKFDRNAAEKLNKMCLTCARLKYVNENKDHNLERLLSSELESYYWMGFLLADAHFSNSGQFTISISAKDELHLQKLCNFIGYKKPLTIKIGSPYNKTGNYCGFTIYNLTILNKIKEKFDIHNRKTYNPPKLEIFKSLTDDQNLSILCGLIDGDGCIYQKNGQPTAMIRITMHRAWQPILQFFSKFFETNAAHINASGLSCLGSRTFPVLKKIKQFAVDNHLPILDRKWNKINLNHITSKEKSDKLLLEIKKFYERGLKASECAKKIGLTPREIRYVYNKLKRLTSGIKK